MRVPNIKGKLIAKAIKSTTRRQYASAVKWIKEILAELGEKTLTESVFFKIIHATEGVFEGHKAEQLRDAVLHHLRETGEWSSERSWIEHPDTLKACRGYRYQNGTAPSTPRGATTDEGVKNLAAKLIELKKPQFVPMLYIRAGAALRRQEIMHLQIGDYNEASRCLTLRVNKSRTAKRHTRQRTLLTKSIIDEEAHEALCMMQRIYTNKGELMFPKHRAPMGEFDKLFKEWYQKDHPDLTYVPHSLRHGGVTKIMQKTQKDPELQRATTLQSQSMRKWYSRSNEQRYDESKRNRARAANSKRTSPTKHTRVSRV
jgi:hypothetical protein